MYNELPCGVKMTMPEKPPREVLTEPFVQKCVLKYLAENGWSTSLRAAELWEQGVDIKVRNDKFSRYWLIEAKGDPSLKVKQPSGSMSSCFNSAVGQIMTRMHRSGKRGYKYGYKYGVAFPASFRTMVLRKMPYDVMDKLNLYLFFVSKTGAVEMIDWKQMKEISKTKAP
jgi:hypothetical protein